jgi:membrane protease YdiL (CAAX protease family)
MLPEIVFKEITGSMPDSLIFVRLISMLFASVILHFLELKVVAKYALVLSVIIIAEFFTKQILLSTLWIDNFDPSTFMGNFGGSILLKVIGVVPVVLILVILFKSPKNVYLTKGDLTVKADEMKWLNIKKDKIGWGKLALISAVLISLGTILLTVSTVTGSSTILNVDNLVKYLPLVFVFAAINSLCEGIVFRSAILGSIKHVLPKNQAILISALIFGIAHYYGAPSGIIGVVMSTFLGWYMTISMYETKGFASSWIIHFMQDVVIFSTILLLNNYY